ncbi:MULTISPECIES: hypothetical protein [Oceanobacillus]|uniref:Uncharacterized protein n=1 Tax=Oceanobacillus profundus TaxID=372463 RepID=A0A417YAE6_9BACI|nr:hypothetical protein [Oceanobacillus profundus]MBR3119211.1 hypothetical protein [Oceanobacillus sp.]PAE27004.1 hypothetical protein CHI07_21790 [Paenibacillus sp. 7884-2]MCM3397110.1 hypothetical protein [Oceanobacillus profundus]MDO6449346.1 hypothetical protein [Oceanobacillus profundus]RHW29662.1 hypothetical protein D1B32_20830 [Oceanobacillus profundus]
MVTNTDLKIRFSQLEAELGQTQNYIKEKLKNLNKSSFEGAAFCYFNQTVVLDYEQYSTHQITGDFHIKNLSATPVELPRILLKITTEDEFKFTGKYKSSNQNQQTHNFEWERIELGNVDPITHYLLKPVQAKEIYPTEQLSFQDFQIIIPFGTTIRVDGFVYFEGKQDGISAINSINIAG